MSWTLWVLCSTSPRPARYCCPGWATRSPRWPQMPTWSSRLSCSQGTFRAFFLECMLITPLPQTFGGSITVWKAQPGPEGPLDPCPAFFFGLVSRLFPSPRLCDIVMLNATDLPASPSLQLAVLLVWNAFYPSSESLEQFSLNHEVEFRA